MARIRSAGDVELNAVVQTVVITEDRRAAAEELVGSIDGLSLADALATPFLALGTPDEIATASSPAAGGGASATTPSATSTPSPR